MTEFLAHVEAVLAGQISEPTLKELAAIQADLQHTQSRLTMLLDAGEITSDQYLQRFNDALRAAMDQSRRSLGDERFHAVFGEAGNNPDGLVDKEKFMEYAASEGRA